MNKAVIITTIVFSIILCVMFIVAVVDTNETEKEINFSKENIITHIDKLSENGPRSIADKEANRKALEYLISQVEGFGVVNGDRVDAPAYMVQDFVATDSEDTKYQSWYLKNLIVHIPANAENKTGEAVMFMGHYDSVPMGQGSSDDAVACSVMLEAINYYLDKMENGYVLTNDLVFCFVNGEEYGLYGSEAFMNEFEGFDNVVNRIKFGTNLESRGTSGTLIMFETSKNNYNTVKLFAEMNENIFTCSIATMVYDMMPNGTDFSNFKEAYQGLNMANIGGGEDYHTQNDNPDNVGDVYISQQAQIVDKLIDKLSSYELSSLYEADESAVFFSYLNVTTVVYNHAVTYVLAIVGILMLVANILLSVFYRKENNVKNTAKSIGALLIGLVVAAVAAYLCYFVFQLIAAMFGTIDVHAIGKITYSNTAIVIGLGMLALAVTVITTHFACKWFKVTRRDLTRAFAYMHIFLGIVLSFAVADASYLFIFSGIMLMINELVITLVKRTDASKYHGELLASALYFPIVIPVIVLATSALGLTMAYVYGLIFAIAVFGIGISIYPICKYASVRTLYQVCRKKEITANALEGGLHILAISLLIFFVVSCIKPNASVNLQGKQNISTLPYDDALVYVVDEKGEREYRVYDLNAYSALEAYRPEKMEYEDGYYAGAGEKKEISHSIMSTSQGKAINVIKTEESSLIYLDFTDINAKSFTIFDGVTSSTYELGEEETYSIKLHSNCTVTLNDGTATVEYKEVIRDYESLIPSDYNQEEQLHFNLWLTKTIELK